MIKTRREDDIDAWLGDANDDRPRGCQWDETVCTDAPTHRIVPPEHGWHHDEPRVYCLRHYALTLARLAMVHLPGCDGAASTHVHSHGPVT